jgi:hypothetical protein
MFAAFARPSGLVEGQNRGWICGGPLAACGPHLWSSMIHLTFLLEYPCPSAGEYTRSPTTRPFLSLTKVTRANGPTPPPRVKDASAFSGNNSVDEFSWVFECTDCFLSGSPCRRFAIPATHTRQRSRPELRCRFWPPEDRELPSRLPRARPPTSYFACASSAITAATLLSI